jgi:threonine dehydratase
MVGLLDVSCVICNILHRLPRGNPACSRPLALLIGYMFMSFFPAASSLSLERIAEAYLLIPKIFRDSPQFVAEGLSRLLGLRVLCKVECINPIRSFKGRGAWNFLARDGRSDETLVTASAGNFGQGLAYAARACDQRVIIFAATTADQGKVAKMRALDAEVRLTGSDFDAAKEAARGFALERGMRFIEDGREPAIAEGAGTIAVELCQWPQPIDAVIVPIGNGALVNGIGRWLHANATSCRVIGACAQGAPAMAESWRSGRLCATAKAETVADTIAVRNPVPEALEEMRASVDEIVLVSDDQLREAVGLLHKELGLVVEHSGAASLAVAMQVASRYRDRLVSIVISGGNLA